MNWFFILIVLGVLGLSDAFPSTDDLRLANASYSEVENFIRISGGYIYHMEADLCRRGNILFADRYSLKTTDGSSTQIIAGSPTSSGYQNGRGTYARFHSIYGFYQLNATHVLAADFEYHCTRMINRQTTMTTTFAGRCCYGSNRNAVGTYARFYYPRKITQDPTNSNSLVILQGFARTYTYLRLLNVDTRLVTTALTSGLYYPRDMAWSSDKRALYISHSHHVSKVDWATKRVTRLAGSSQFTPRFGLFSQTRFNNLEELIPLKDNRYVVTERNSRRLTILDMANNISVPLCFKNKCTLDLSYLYSSVLVNDALYVGGYRGIVKLTGYSCILRDEIVYIKPLESTATITFNAAGHTGEFPVGEYKFYVPAGVCSSYTVKVLKSSIARRIAFKVNYAVKCHIVNNAVGKVFLEPVLQHIMTDFQEVCLSACVMSKTLKPIYNCSNNVLTVIWPTDTAYAEDVKQLPTDVDNMLKTRLQSAGKRKAELPLIMNVPQLVLPEVDSNGRRIQVVFYDTKTD